MFWVLGEGMMILMMSQKKKFIINFTNSMLFESALQ